MKLEMQEEDINDMHIVFEYRKIVTSLLIPVRAYVCSTMWSTSSPMIK